MTTTHSDDTNLTRPCRINGILIRADGLVCTFQANSWLEFSRTVVEQADGMWGRYLGIARLFGCEEGRGVEEHSVAECRRVAAAVAAT